MGKYKVVLFAVISAMPALSGCGGGDGGGGGGSGHSKAWGDAGLIETLTGDAGAPQIAFDAGGNALAVWQQDAHSAPTSILANRYTAGSGWGRAEVIDTGALQEAGSTQIAVAPNGDALAVWYQHDGTRYNIRANRYTAGKGWGWAELIEGDDAGDARDPQIAFDAEGNALAVWSQYYGGYDNIWANRFE